MLAAVAPHTARHFGRALVMPNLVPPVTTVDAARAYQQRIRAALPANSGFRALLTCYLTDDISADEVVRGHREGVWAAAKLYPANATTNASHGVTDVPALTGVLDAMAAADMPLCVHGEVTDPDVDVFDREAVFLDTILAPLMERVPRLRVVLEHATTAAAVAFVRAHPHVAATITPHHLWWNRNALFAGGLRPHAYCLPVLKRETDRRALVDAATSGNPQFFAGTDSAPHLRGRKERDHGCAGVFCAPTAVPAYTTVFEQADALPRLAGFLSEHGAAFYGVAPATEILTLQRASWTPVEAVGGVRVFLGGESLPWQVVDSMEPGAAPRV